MSDNLPFARDVVDINFVLLSTDKTVAEACEKLTQAGRTYGVVISRGEAAVGLVSMDALLSASNSNLRLGEFLSMPAFIVDADALLEQAVAFSAQTLVENPEMTGLVVESNGDVVGIITRQTARKYAQRIRTRGGEVTELAGDSQSRAKFFACPKQDYRKLIIQYDPDNPPTCPNDGLVLIKQSS